MCSLDLLSGRDSPDVLLRLPDVRNCNALFLLLKLVQLVGRLVAARRRLHHHRSKARGSLGDPGQAPPDLVQGSQARGF